MNDDTPIRAALADLVAFVRPYLEAEAKSPDYGISKTANLRLDGLRWYERLALAATEPAEPPEQIMREALELVQNYPDFTEPDSVFGAVIADALKGRRHQTLIAVDYLSRGECPPAEQSRSASSLTEPVVIIDSPETGWPSRIIDGRHVPCAHDGRVAATEIRAAPSEPTERVIEQIARGWLGREPTDAERRYALDKLAALRPSAVLEAAPPGFVMVPVEPTDAMQEAGARAIRMDTTALNRIWTGNAVWRAMVRASTPSPSPTGEKP